MSKIFNVLIVDDSIIFRKSMENAFRAFDSFHVIGSVWNGAKVLPFLQPGKYPDLITLDIEMPEMDGIETLKKIQEFNATLPAKQKIAVLMVSSKTRLGTAVTIQALELGAFDFITKPEGNNAEETARYIHAELESKLSYFTEINSTHPQAMTKPETQKKKKNYKIIAIGISTGGPKTLSDLLPQLSEKINLPIVIAQHIPVEFTQSLAKHLDSKCSKHTVREAAEGMAIEKGGVYLAPGDRNLIIRWNETNHPVCSLNSNLLENGCFPSVDFLFRSVANIYQDKAIALIMTGMGQDGTAGLGAFKRQGGLVIAQNEASSIVWGMPARAIESGNVDHILDVSEIPQFIYDIVE